MNQIVFAAQQTRGRRSSLTEQLHGQMVTTAGGLALTVAIAADGKSGSQGQRAAELTVNFIVETIQKSPASKPTVIPFLLRKALVGANHLVYNKAQEERWRQTVGTTVTVVAIHAQKLYLANVGNCRAYLIRNKQVTQLTRDHTWAYEMIRQGRVTETEAMVHPKADSLMRAIGNEADVTVDLGLYLSSAELEEEAFQNQGYPLQLLDRVLICTDGLVKSRSNLHLALAEMVKIISQKGAEKAAAALVEQAEAQEIKDNLSVIVLEVSSGKEKTLASQLAFNLPDIPKMLADFSLPVWSNIPRSGKYAVAGIAGLVLLFLVILVATLPGDDGGDGSVADVPTAVSETQPLVEDEPALPDEETQSALPDSAVAAGNGRLLLPGLSSAWSLIVAAGMMMAAAIMLKTALKAVG